MSNQSNLRRSGTGRGDNQYHHHRSYAPNYSNIYDQPNGRGNRSSSNNGRNDGYPIVVTHHRMEQQYTMQVLNSVEQQQHRQIGNSSADIVASVPPTHSHHHHHAPAAPSHRSSAESTQALSAAVVPFNNHDAPSTPASSSTLSASTDDEDFQIPELDAGGRHYQELGETLGTIYLKSTLCISKLRQAKKLKKKLVAEKEDLENQLSALQQEKDAESKLHHQQISFQQNENAKVSHDCNTWKDNAMKLNTQLEAVNVQLAERVTLMKSQENEINNLKQESARLLETIKKMEQTEKQLKTTVDDMNRTIDRQKNDIAIKCKEAQNFESKYNKKSKDFKALEDGSAAMKKELKTEILDKQKRMTELEQLIVEWQNKYKHMKEACDKNEVDAKNYKNLNDQLEKDKMELNSIIDQKKSEIDEACRERDTLKHQLDAKNKKLNEQMAQLNQQGSDIDELKKKNAELSQDLDEKKEVHERIVEEHMEIYTKPTILNQIVQKKLQGMTLSAPLRAAIPQLQRKSLEFTSCPVAAEEETPEPSSSVEQENESSASNGDGLGHRKTGTIDTSRKRKISATTTTNLPAVKSKEPRTTNSNSVQQTLGGEMKEQKDSLERGRSKVTEPTMEHCWSRGKISVATANQQGGPTVTVSTGNNRNNENSVSTRASQQIKRRAEHNKIVPQETIQIKFPNPNFNLKKSK